MDCTRCHRENSTHAKFCLGCGHALNKSCSKCWEKLPPDASFCDNCGFDLSTAADELASTTVTESGERRQATVLFSDLTDFAALGERLDPEEVECLMRPLKERILSVVAEHGGIVSQFLGDEVLALFGVPTAHDDDPIRAVRTARAIHKVAHELSPEVEKRAGRSLRMHTGVHTGILVTSTSDARDGLVGVTGDVVNTAARLRSVAEPDEILVSSTTQRLIAAVVETEFKAEMTLKGKRLPVMLHRVLGDRRVPMTPLTPMAGRKIELRRLEGFLDTCLEEGRGVTIVLRGEAGIGKTRLVSEFTQRASRRGFICHTDPIFNLGICPARNVVGKIAESLLDLAPAAEEQTRRDAADAAAETGLITRDGLVFLYDLLELPQPGLHRSLLDAMSSEQRHRGRRQTLARLMLGYSARTPLIVAVEDIHWADALSLGDLASLANATAGSPVLLIMTTRVDGNPVDGAWRSAASEAHLTTIELRSLAEAEAVEIAERIRAEKRDVSPETASECLKRAAGNPLFLEQLLLNAGESTNQPIPASVQSLVLARVDRLPPRDKFALQVASVIGQRFSQELLAHLLGDADYDCSVLAQRYLVRPQGQDFMFLHVLIQEVVYESLLKSRRRQLHRRTAGWFASSDPTLRAEHLDRAGEPDAGEAFLEAARAEAKEYHYEQALALTRRGQRANPPEHIAAALRNLEGQLLHDLGMIADSLAAYESALELAVDAAQRITAWIGLAAGMRITERLDEAMALLATAQEVAERESMELELSRIHHLRGNLHFPRADFDACLAEHQLALDYARRVGSFELQASAQGGLGDANFARGRMLTAAANYRDTVHVAKRHGLGRIEAAHRSMLANCLLFDLQLEQSLDQSCACIESALHVGHLRAEIRGRHAAGLALEFMGRHAEAQEHHARSLTLSRQLKAHRFEVESLTLLGLNEIGRGNHDSGRAALEAALSIARAQTLMAFMGPILLSTLALTLCDSSERDSALDEGARILAQGSLGNNHLMFHANAIDVQASARQWSQLETHAAALDEYTRQERIPWADFHIRRARALVAVGRGQRDSWVETEVRELLDWARRVKWLRWVPALQEVARGIEDLGSAHRHA